MASPITFSGLASGIDSASLINSLIESRRASRVTPLETKKTELNDTSSSLTSLKELLTTLREKAQKFRSIEGGILAKNATSSNESVVTAVSSSGAENGTYEFTVSQLARIGTSSFNDRFSDTSSAINSSINNSALEAERTVEIEIGTGGSAETVSIALSNTTSVDEFVSSFNAQSTKALATAVNVGTTASPSYAIVLSSRNQGTEDGTIAVSVGSEITTAGTGAFAASTLSQAANAEFTVSGISGTITRSSNTISDVISGLSVSLKDTGTSTVTIDSDPETTIQSLQDFVDAYNEILTFIRERDTITREDEEAGSLNIFGPLAQSSLDENVISSLRSAFSSSSISGNTVNTLADLGITTQRDGSLAFDEDTFREALADDPTSVQTITENLGESLAAVDGTIAQFTRFGGLFDSETQGISEQVIQLNNRISTIEKSIAKEEESLVGRFSRLESLIGKLNAQQSALSGLI
jgi:flagellar hook-associated protein 2